MEITRQADYYGLPTPERESIPSAEKVADVLKAPTPWQGPMKVAKTEEDDDEESDSEIGDELGFGSAAKEFSSMFNKVVDHLHHHGEHLPGLANPVRPTPPLATQGPPTAAVEPETQRVNQATEPPAGRGRS